MAVRSPVFAVTNTAYVKIGDAVTSITAQDSAGEAFYIVVVDVGDAVPAVDVSTRTTVGGVYSRTGSAVDVYARSIDNDSIIQVQI